MFRLVSRKLKPKIEVKHNSQFYIFNLFGNFIEPRHRPVWTHELLRMMQTLGVEDKTTRSTLARMRQKGWLSVEKVGRQSRYALTPKGLEILTEGDERIFEQPPESWNGRWHLVTYSLPDKLGHLRNPLVKKLRWAGYGNLNRGTWISPIDRSHRLLPFVAELEIEEHVLFFGGAQKIGQLADQELVGRCWDIATLENDYRNFLDAHQPHFERGKNRDAEDAFRQFFWLSQAFQAFPRQDPNLPKELLPIDWIGHKARILFDRYRDQLAEEMRPFIEQILDVEKV